MPKIIENTKRMRVKESEVLYMYIIHISVLLFGLSGSHATKSDFSWNPYNIIV